MSYSSALTDKQWALLEPRSTRPASADPSTHRTSGGWWTRCCTSPTPAASGATCPSRSDPGRGCGRGRTKGAKRVVTVDVTGLPVDALVLPTSTHENRASELMLEHLTQQGTPSGLSWSWWTGVTAAAARTLGRNHDLELRRVGWDDKQPCSAPIRHAWHVEVPHGRLGRARRPCEVVREHPRLGDRPLQVACIATTLPHLSRVRAQPALPLAARPGVVARNAAIEDAFAVSTSATSSGGWCRSPPIFASTRIRTPLL